MNILLFLEPVIYRCDPDALIAHFPWVACFHRVSLSMGGRFGIVANRETCRAWRGHAQVDHDIEMYELDSFPIISEFHDKVAYSQALYEVEPPNSVLLQRLREIRSRFRPDVVLTTAQNAYAVKAFDGIAMLHVEQPALPRLGHPFRTGLDPCGHQVGAFVERYRDTIVGLDLPAGVMRGAGDLLDHVRQTRLTLAPLAQQSCEALSDLAGGQKIALLATQPTDAVTYEGAYRPVEMHDLLYDWAERLPEGWVGVPTYHAGQQLCEELEQALASSSARIRFLPRQLSCGLSEALMTKAEGLVTISSTSAMSALLFGKRAVVVGRSPLTNWCANSPERIEDTRVLDVREASRCMAVLTHHFSMLHDQLMEDPGAMRPHLTKVREGAAADWYLDLTDWSLARSERLFADVRLTKPAQAAVGTQSAEQLEHAEVRAQWQRTISQRDQLNEQIAAICIDRDKMDADRAAAIAQADMLAGEVASAIADRAKLDADRAAAIVQADVLARELAAAIADRVVLDQGRADAVARLDLCAGELASAIADRAKLDADRAAAIVQADVLARELAAAIADRAALDQARADAMIQADAFRAELSIAISGRDQFRDELERANQQLAVLAQRLFQAIAQSDKLDHALGGAMAKIDVLTGDLAAAVDERDRAMGEMRVLHGECLALQSRLNAVRAFWNSNGVRRLTSTLLGYRNLEAAGALDDGIDNA